MTLVKRNPVKQIMSNVHKDVRAGRLALDGHDGFIREVRRRLAAAGLREPSDHENPHPGTSYEEIVGPPSDGDSPRQAESS